ncbi:type VI secretion system Vgr family protein [Paracoccus lutimaris]|uniref:Type VI secretion system secreted protein VgrG n=1 Tax=Paracoccus lutimaris TaxID=1490030 RepID=A0A368Z973_9RHOB|nr:type VI secretion system tip protein TssI/VgrG [Paracoccus lutimaris]RCW89002.1 type VI secretion system secreted protein VgrG [Paracoccus lutimaris]
MPTDRFAKLTTPLPGDEMLASTPMTDFTGLAFQRMRGDDGISRCFEYEISAISGTPDVKADALLGAEVGLCVVTDREKPDCKRYFHGIVDRFHFAGTDEEGHWLYRLVVRPRMWLLSKTTDNRIFQEKSVKDIVSEVLDQHGCSDYEWDLRGTPAPRSYCVQYGESDLDFVQRLLEHEGIFYFFRFTDGKHTLVLCDDLELLQAADGGEKLAFREKAADRYGGGGVISRFSRVDGIVPGSHSLTDYDFEKPSADLLTKTDNPGDHAGADGARYSYPGRYVEHGRGGDLADIRNQEDQVHAHVITALSTASAPAAGNIFDLIEFPRQQENITYVIERAAYDIRGEGYRSPRAEKGAAQRPGQSLHEGFTREAESAGFAALYTLLPRSITYRPPRVTPRPSMKGPQTAVVVGPAGEEIYTDKYSRVKVQFHWDRLGRSNEHSTCFVRVSSAWAGSGWGFIHVPRIGQEVIVDFLEGDPDQPIITGRVYNAEQMPPYELPGNATQSGWKSNSSPGGGGWNELRFEDKKGSEEVYFQAEKDHNELVKNNESRQIGNDWFEDVGHDATQSIGHDRTESVGNNKSTSVSVDRTVNIGDNDTETVGKDRSLTVGINETISVGSNSTETIGANHSQTVGANQTISVGLARTDTVGAAETRTIGAAQALTVGAGRAVSVGAAQVHAIGSDDSWSIGGNQSTEIDGDQSLQVGKSKTETIGENISSDAGKNIVIKAGDSITLTCGKAKLQLKKDGTIVIEGKDLSIKGSGKIGINASSDVTIKGSTISQN